jgi:hypothetical protein
MRAAAYCDVCEPIFDGLVKTGILPPPRQLTPTIKAWDRGDRAIDTLTWAGTGAKNDPA